MTDNYLYRQSLSTLSNITSHLKTMKNIIFLVLFFYHMVFGLKEEDDNLSKIDEDMIMVIGDKIISERMEVLENKMSRQFDARHSFVWSEMGELCI